MNCSKCGTLTADGMTFCPSCGGAIGGSLPNVAPVAGQETTYAMLCHLTALSGYIIPFGNLIGPLIVWLIKRDESALVNEHGKESLNFQISMSIYAIISAFCIFLVIGIPMLIAVGFVNLIFVIVASVKAASGEFYRYPLTIRFLK